MSFDAAYVPVVLLFLWVAWRAGRVWYRSRRMEATRQIVFFAQHYSVFVILISGTAIGLSAWTMVYASDAAGLLSRLWAFFDALIALLLAAQLRNLEMNLMAGRQG
ncbi:MAG: hypothetical protein ACPGF7_13650 [Pontibacterium sp.]